MSLDARVAGGADGQNLPVRHPWPAEDGDELRQFCRLDPVVSCNSLGFFVFAHLQETPYNY
jgi:hypothetical protein